jgi:hypothetical protein
MLGVNMKVSFRSIRKKKFKQEVADATLLLNCAVVQPNDIGGRGRWHDCPACSGDTRRKRNDSFQRGCVGLSGKCIL